MNEILKAILENAARNAAQQQGARRAPAVPQQPAPSQAADPMQAILEGILGGAQRPAAPQPQQTPNGAGGLQDLIGGILGGAQRSGMNQAGGIADLIGILGGGRGGGIMGGNAGTNAIADMLAQRLGISPMIARVVVAFFVAKFMGRMAEGVQQRRQQGATPQQPGDPYDYEYNPQDNADGLDLDSILDDVDDNFALKGHFSDNGMATELAQMTGMDVKTANEALAEIAKMVGQERRAVRPVRVQKKSALQDLLDTW